MTPRSLSKPGILVGGRGVKRRVRVELIDPAKPDVMFPVWADVEAEQGGRVSAVSLLHDYPDLKPQAGWLCAVGPERNTVTAVALPRLDLAPVAEAARESEVPPEGEE